MVAESVLASIADNPRLPTPPTLALRLLDQANRPSCTIHEIGKIISLDPSLCGKMLKLVNSTLFGLQRPVTSIDRALNLLGLNHVRSLVLSLSLPSLRFRSASTECMKDYWKRSVTAAIVCRELAVLRKWPDPDSEMVAGLLCDLGELLLQESNPDKHAAVTSALRNGAEQDRCELEVRHFGVDHAEAGAYCLRRWKLADELTEAIRYHHRPELAPPEAANRAYLLSLAGCIARLHIHAEEPLSLGQVVSLARERFGLSHEQLLSFLESLNGKIDGFAALIEVDLGPRESFADLFTKATENLTRLAVETSLENVRVLEEKSQVEHGLRLAQESLQKTEEQLRQAQKMEAIGRLAGGISHDFNNLLTVMLGNCDLVLDLPGLAAEAREMIELIRQTGERAADLTRQLLAFSRKQRLIPEVVQLNAIVSNTTKLLRHLIGADIQLVTRLADDLTLVRVDPGQMGQVIMNLAVNARDAMPKGGCLTIETFNLEVSEEVAAKNPELHPGCHAVLAVRDTGCGMDESVLRHVFEPFFTTKEKGKGTGLGLATVHGIVRQSGGTVTVASVVGQGTAFHIYLPATKERCAPDDTVASAVIPTCGSETILVAEDKDDVRDFMCKSLESYSYTVLAARDGAEALEVEHKFAAPIHLLLTDIVMPAMNGGELAAQMARRRPSMKILFTSGYAGDNGKPESGNSALTPFLQKPFTPKVLAAKVREVLESVS